MRAETTGHRAQGQWQGDTPAETGMLATRSFDKAMGTEPRGTCKVVVHPLKLSAPPTAVKCRYAVRSAYPC